MVLLVLKVTEISFARSFFRAKTETLNAKPYCAPLPPEKPKDDNLPHDIQCEVCGFKFIPYNSSRYIAVGKHNYGKFHYYNGGAIISDTAIVDGLHDAFDCPMCGCQIVVHPYLPVYAVQRKKATTSEATAMQRLIDAIHLEQSLPTSSPADNNHVMTRHFAVESFRALIKAEPP